MIQMFGDGRLKRLLVFFLIVREHERIVAGNADTQGVLLQRSEFEITDPCIIGNIGNAIYVANILLDFIPAVPEIF